QVGDEVRRGVVFIRELVPRRAIAFVARTFYKEDYVALPMAHEIRSAGDNRLRVAYRWRSENRWSAMNLETDGESELPGEGSVEQFITEHYWGYSAQPGGGCVEYRVTHPSWKIWQVRRSAFEGDAEKLYGREIATVLRNKPQSAFLAGGSAVTVIWGRCLFVCDATDLVGLALLCDFQFAGLQPADPRGLSLVCAEPVLRLACVQAVAAPIVAVVTRSCRACARLGPFDFAQGRLARAPVPTREDLRNRA